jgi:hypothetical protein
MTTPQEFKQRWERVAGDRLVAFPATSLADVRISHDVHALLTEAGLPRDAAPFLNFEPPESGTLQRVSTVWHQSSDFDRYRIIGGTGSGDPVGIDEATSGEVVYLNHDNRFQRVVMGASIFTLTECLLRYRDLIVEVGGDTSLISAAQRETLLAGFRELDPTAIAFWQSEIGCVEEASAKPWWRFW